MFFSFPVILQVVGHEVGCCLDESIPTRLSSPIPRGGNFRVSKLYLYFKITNRYLDSSTPKEFLMLSLLFDLWGYMTRNVL